MSKYLTILKLSWHKTIHYRFNFFIGQIRGLIVVFTLYFFYTAIFTGSNSLFGFDQQKIITYVLLSNILFAFIFEYRMNAIADSISSGEFNSYLLKPMSYFNYQFTMSISTRLINMFFSIISVAVFVLVMRPKLFLAIPFNQLVLFLAATILAALLFSVLDIIIGLSAFWMLNSYGPRFVFKVIIELMAGRFFPLSVLSPMIQAILKFLPIGYVLYFPVTIYFGIGNINTWLQTIGLIILWTVVSLLTYKLVWRRGLKVYGAFGS